MVGGTQQTHGVFLLKMISTWGGDWGYPYFWKHPSRYIQYIYIYMSNLFLRKIQQWPEHLDLWIVFRSPRNCHFTILASPTLTKSPRKSTLAVKQPLWGSNCQGEDRTVLLAAEVFDAMWLALHKVKRQDLLGRLREVATSQAGWDTTVIEIVSLWQSNNHIKLPFII